MKELFARTEGVDAASFRNCHIILDALPVAVSWAGLPGGEIRFINRAFTRLFGYGEKHFLTVDQWISEVYDTSLEQEMAREHWAALWRSEQSGIGQIEPLELKVRCADGSFRTTQHRGALLWDIGIAVATFEDISPRKKTEDAVRRMAMEDPLTELANRRALQERWQSEICSEHSEPMAVLLIDLDGFKPVNDQHGHDTGDQVLMMVAARLLACVRNADVVGRIGGDEFVVLLFGLGDGHEADEICRRIHNSLTAPFICDGSVIEVGASIGVSLYPQDGQTLEALIRSADQALYRRKKSNTGGWEWFAKPAA